MTYADAKEILRDASGLCTGASLSSRLRESPGCSAPIDSSIDGDLPAGDSFADEILRALLVVRHHLAGQAMMERDLAGVLAELIVPVRLLASDRQYDETRIQQLSMVLDWVFHAGGAHGAVEG